MHQRLLEQALRRGWVWVALAILLSPALPAFAAYAVVQSPFLLIGVWVFFLVVAAVMMRLPYRFGPQRTQIKVETVDAPANVNGVIEQIGIALGSSRSTTALVARHESINVGTIRDGNQTRLLITDGALKALTRDELESLIASQMAMQSSGSLRRLQACASWLSWARWSALVVIGAFVPFPPFQFICVITALWSAWMWFCMPRLSWWLRVAFDGICVETTRYPEPLPRALMKVALYNGDRLPMTLPAQMGCTDLSWTSPVSLKFRSTTSVNGKTKFESSAELEADLRLLLSAQLITDVCVYGKPATFDSWLRARKVVRGVQSQIAAGEQRVQIGKYFVTLDGLVEAEETDPGV